MAGGDLERVAPGPVAPPRGVDLQFDEPGLAQDAEMLRHGRGREIQLGGQIAGRNPCAVAALKDGSPGCVGQRP